MAEPQDWFASNAPKSAGGDWFAANAAKTPARSDVQVVGRVQSDDPREQIHEPTTFWSGFGQSILNQMGVGNPDSPLSHAARPQTAGDIGSLLLPNAVDLAVGAGAAAAPTVQRYATPAVARAIGDEIPGVNRILRIKDKIQAIRNAADFPVGPTAEPLGPVPAPDFHPLDVGPRAQPFGPKLGAPPTRIRGIVTSPSEAAAVEAAAPQTAKVIPSVEDLKATMASPESADTPRDWHSGATDPAMKARMAAAHELIMDENMRYRNATAGERAQFQAMPKDYKDALISALLGGK